MKIIIKGFSKYRERKNIVLPDNIIVEDENSITNRVVIINDNMIKIGDYNTFPDTINEKSLYDNLPLFLLTGNLRDLFFGKDSTDFALLGLAEKIIAKFPETREYINRILIEDF